MITRLGAVPYSSPTNVTHLMGQYYVQIFSSAIITISEETYSIKPRSPNLEAHLSRQYISSAFESSGFWTEWICLLKHCQVRADMQDLVTCWLIAVMSLYFIPLPSSGGFPISKYYKKKRLVTPCLKTNESNLFSGENICESVFIFHFRKTVNAHGFQLNPYIFLLHCEKKYNYLK